MTNQAPPKASYLNPIDSRSVLSPAISDEACRVLLLLQAFYAQRDGRSKPSAKVETLGAVAGWNQPRIEHCLGELAEIGLLERKVTGWDPVGEPTFGGHEIADALGLPLIEKVKIDTRTFFCPALSPEAIRLWTIASLRPDADRIILDDLEWEADDLESVGKELVKVGLASMSMTKTGCTIKALPFPQDGPQVREFLFEELGKGRGTTSDAIKKEMAERKRRAASRSK